MLNAALLSFDAGGRIRTVNSGAFSKYFNGGTPMNDTNQLVIQQTAPASPAFLGGIAYEGDAVIVRGALPRPAFDLVFEEGVNNPLMTFSGGGNGTRIDSHGVLVPAVCPRIQYNPDTGALRGLLVEDTRTNRLLFSSTDLGGFVGNNATRTANFDQAPNAKAEAFLVSTTATSDAGVQLSPAGMSVSTNYALSVRVKRGGPNPARYVYMRTRATTNGATASSSMAVFDLQTNTLGVKGGDITSALIEGSVGGWTIITIAFTSGATIPSNVLDIKLTDANDFSQSVAVGKTVLMWGPQFEAGNAATSYIETQESTVTRTSDEVMMNPAQLSPLWNPAAGTIVVDAEAPLASSLSGFPPQYCFGPGSGTGDEINAYWPNQTKISTEIKDNAVLQAQGSTGTVVAPGDRCRSGIAFQVNDFASYWNGVQQAVDSVLTIPTIDRMSIGSFRARGQGNLSVILTKRLTYWASRLSNTALQELTTLPGTTTLADLAPPSGHGLPVGVDGALLVSFDQPVVSNVQGIPLDANGLVALASPGAVVVVAGIGDQDNDGLPDTLLLESPPVTVTIDADSINIDVNGDHVADIIVPR